MDASALDMKGCLEDLEIGALIPNSVVWKRLLNEWCSVMNDYAAHSVCRSSWAKSQGGDLAYWNEERANVGFIAAAVWRLGGVAVQEFEVTRPGKTKGAKGDLWFNLDDLSCQIEAKDPADRVSIPSEETIGDELSEARRELLELPPSERAPIGVAMVFVVPGVQGVSFDFHRLMRQVKNNRRLSAIYRPGRNCNILDAEDGVNYPGVALVGELVWLHSNG